MSNEILKSIKLIKNNIKNIVRTQKDFDNKIIALKYYIDSLKINFVEMGEECKILNDFIKKETGKWDDPISSMYNFRISLTHYYKKMKKSFVRRFKKEKFPLFIGRIQELEKKYG